MNIVQLCNKVDFFLDSERSPRFEPAQKIKAINTAINDILNDRYDNIKRNPKEKEYSFQNSQRLRDELYTLVRYQDNILATPNTNIIPAAGFPTDYRFLLLMEAVISGKTINAIPLTYDEMNVVDQNPYFRPSIVWPERIYRIESNEGITVKFGSVGRLTSANFYYIKKPAVVSLGMEVNVETTQLFKPNSIIAFVPTVLYCYDVNGQYMGMKALAEEEEYEIGSFAETSVKVHMGIVYVYYTNTDFPETLHEEICRVAAKILSGNVENYNRQESLKRDIKEN